MNRAIVLYVAIQSVVIASPTPGLQQYSDQTGTGTFYHPTPASRAWTLPELGKLPRTSAASKKFNAGGSSSKLTPAASNHAAAARKGRISTLLDAHQQLPHRHVNNIIFNEPHQKVRPSMSEEERAEKVNAGLEKMIQFMTVLGQVDRYLSSRAKSFVTTLGRAMENSPNDQDIYNDRDNVMSSLEY